MSLGKENGSYFIKGPTISNFNFLVTCHPQNIEYILKTNFSNFPKGSESKEIFDVLGDGLGNADDQSWISQRKLAHKCIKSTDFRGFVASTSHRVVAQALVPLLAHVADNNSVIDLQDVCTRFAFECNMSTSFGRREGYLSSELPTNELCKALDDIHEALIFRHILPRFIWKLLRFLNVGREGDYAKGCKKIDQHFGEYISQKKECLKKGAEMKDLLSIFIKYLDEPSLNDKFLVDARLNTNFLRDLMLGIFLAEKDAIASSLTFLLWLIAKTPYVEETILEELKMIAYKKDKLKQEDEDDEDGVGAKWPILFDSNDLNGLVYLHASICESLRLYPSVPIIKKSIIKDDILPDGSAVKTGMQIFLSFYAEGQMPWIWGEDSMVFKPERWIDDEGKLGHDLMSKFYAFNAGPRTCLGMATTFTEMKVVVAAVLFNFNVRLVEDGPIILRPYVNLNMKDGLPVKISKRTM
ncbi:Cytochrome p450 [Thalictrum thalictroides]|uniref:Cytochrome p450 n=1 Tax=Thalictrum thalictroides TaxID=46969 RepID=A0A7J6W512_THATH|nr:Cytochrome p450 [Thalictrum thalictroides]